MMGLDLNFSLISQEVQGAPVPYKVSGYGQSTQEREQESC